MIVCNNISITVYHTGKEKNDIYISIKEERKNNSPHSIRLYSPTSTATAVNIYNIFCSLEKKIKIKKHKCISLSLQLNSNTPIFLWVKEYCKLNEKLII